MPNLKPIKVKKQKPKYMIGEDELPYYYPSFHVTNKQIPEIKSWEVGKNYKMVIEVNMRSKSEDERSGSKNASASLEVVAYAVGKAKDISKMTDKEFGAYQGEALSASRDEE